MTVGGVKDNKYSVLKDTQDLKLIRQYYEHTLRNWVLFQYFLLSVNFLKMEEQGNQHNIIIIESSNNIVKSIRSLPVLAIGNGKGKGVTPARVGTSSPMLWHQHIWQDGMWTRTWDQDGGSRMQRKELWLWSSCGF